MSASQPAFPLGVSVALPSVREAFDALVSREVSDAALATPEQHRRHIVACKEAWRRLDAGLEQWAGLLAMVGESVRDIIAATQPVAAASFATLQPLLHNDLPVPDWEVADAVLARRDAVEHLERRLALLTQFAASAQMLCVQAGVGVPAELVPLLSPPFRADHVPVAPAPQPLVPPSVAAIPQAPRPGFAPAGKAAEIVESIGQRFRGNAPQAAHAAARQARALKELLDRWSAPEEWAALSDGERASRTALMQSLWDRAQALSAVDESPNV